MLQEIIQDFTGLGGVPLFLTATFLFLATENYSPFNQLIVGFIISYVVVVVARLIYFKERPDRQKFKTIWERIDASSFPSLHSCRVALLGAVVINFFNSVPLTILFIALILGVGISRIMLKRHFFDDVFAGILLGVIIGFANISLF